MTDDHEDCAECLRHELDEARSDIQAYRGALGYPVSGDHDGRLTDGTTPVCGLCNARDRRCGTCYWWRPGDLNPLDKAPYCWNTESECIGQHWSANHGCPQHRANVVLSC